MIQDLVDAVDVVQNLDQIRDLHGLEELPGLALPEDGFHPLAGQAATRVLLYTPKLSTRPFSALLRGENLTMTGQMI